MNFAQPVNRLRGVTMYRGRAVIVEEVVCLGPAYAVRERAFDRIKMIHKIS